MTFYIDKCPVSLLERASNVVEEERDEVGEREGEGEGEGKKVSCLAKLLVKLISPYEKMTLVQIDCEASHLSIGRSKRAHFLSEACHHP